MLSSDSASFLIVVVLLHIWLLRLVASSLMPGSTPDPSSRLPCRFLAVQIWISVMDQCLASLLIQLPAPGWIHWLRSSSLRFSDSSVLTQLLRFCQVVIFGLVLLLNPMIVHERNITYSPENAGTRTPRNCLGSLCLCFNEGLQTFPLERTDLEPPGT